jgi:ABC-type transport system involved in multi-copper enzyme maturation permease subunit
VGLAIFLSIGTSALVSIAIGSTVNDWNDSGLASSGPVQSSMSGLLFSLILLIVLGVTSVTSEYSSRTMHTTFIGNPRRLEVLAAKTLIVGAIGLTVGAIVVPGMFLVGQAIFASYGLETASITDSGVTRFLTVYGLGQATVYTMIPFSIAWLLRSTATAITASIGFLLLPFMLTAVVPAWVQANVLRYMPDVAVDSLAGYTDSGATTYLSQAPAIAVVIIWHVGLLIAAAVVLSRRDV